MDYKLASSIESIGRAAWQSLEPPDFPFLDYPFLKALEDSESIGGASGWDPVYLQASDDQGLAGVLCGFVKSHSYGEYIFDWEWARFYQRFRRPYYPKLVHAAPFTPATGPRVLVRLGAEAQKTREQLIQFSVQMAVQSKLSSVHALFIPENECAAFQEQGFAIRHSLQYHWRNQGYRDFQDYLDSFVGKRRRDMQRERQRAQSHGLEFQCLTGSDLQPQHAELMEQLYLTTAEKKDAIAYLRDGFFQQVFASMSDHILFVIASKDNEPVAGALNFFKGKTLFGRYWGSLQMFQDLHFELCYYQTIDFAIQRRLELFEAGAQGEHKIQRGFRPSLTFSAHRIMDPTFRDPIERFIADERLMIQEAITELDRKSPFKNNASTAPPG
ncbi:MAG TPA: GNAT family N-acetyltransferase [Oligoflexus sp.]|uniref:GNAT family N-acetyltransferase n=1 Tax=Oligoflexus sp. TaxID=1971216 RepID=UPI002D2FE89B|nr:GNAT family N-acetyltransferase [Oligoflexus sp.]HYX34296.1 GNAT family N-acetyltransferase [Oligoflexus sp.]